VLTRSGRYGPLGNFARARPTGPDELRSAAGRAGSAAGPVGSAALSLLLGREVCTLHKDR
jgi:hypothetical protein